MLPVRSPVQGKSDGVSPVRGPVRDGREDDLEFIEEMEIFDGDDD